MTAPAFAAYELRLVFEDHRGNCEPLNYMPSAEEATAMDNGVLFWSLYGCTEACSVECIADGGSFEHAAGLYAQITGQPAPTVPGHYYQLPTGRNRYEKLATAARLVLERREGGNLVEAMQQLDAALNGGDT